MRNPSLQSEKELLRDKRASSSEDISLHAREPQGCFPAPAQPELSKSSARALEPLQPVSLGAEGCTGDGRKASGLFLSRTLHWVLTHREHPPHSGPLRALGWTQESRRQNKTTQPRKIFSFRSWPNAQGFVKNTSFPTHTVYICTQPSTGPQRNCPNHLLMGHHSVLQGTR